MNDVLTTGPGMSKKKPKPPGTDSSGEAPPSEGAGYERVEFQAPTGFTAKVDAAAAGLGLSRSAFCRLAIIRLMRDERPAPPKDDA